MQAGHRGASQASHRLGKYEGCLLVTPAPVFGFSSAWGLRVQCFFQASGSLLPGSRGQGNPLDYLCRRCCGDAGRSSQGVHVVGVAWGVLSAVLVLLDTSWECRVQSVCDSRFRSEAGVPLKMVSL
ncbi:hypothetical protein NDU88_003733 [Pleurodeles waltl]|uniref:Uncharacterized protein n=1 Tax=Pleurodeles waltl TaxID=8319 RepID=A0AAV7M4A3_PLEWA|nr:hypothetical protein NDU88_003733 [Pleurodeles waltl]